MAGPGAGVCGGTIGDRVRPGDRTTLPARAGQPAEARASARSVWMKAVLMIESNRPADTAWLPAMAPRPALMDPGATEADNEPLIAVTAVAGGAGPPPWCV